MGNEPLVCPFVNFTVVLVIRVLRNSSQVGNRILIMSQIQSQGLMSIQRRRARYHERSTTNVYPFSFHNEELLPSNPSFTTDNNNNDNSTPDDQVLTNRSQGVTFSFFLNNFPTTMELLRIPGTFLSLPVTFIFLPERLTLWWNEIASRTHKTLWILSMHFRSSPLHVHMDAWVSERATVPLNRS